LQDTRHLVPVPQSADGTHQVWNFDDHGTNIFTLAAHGAYPGPAGLDYFFFPAQPDQANNAARIESIDAGYRADAGTQAAGLALGLKMRPVFKAAMVECGYFGALGILGHSNLDFKVILF
jgi:hypothetical protein